jgi:mannosyl-3-phosphoglycerate phosphatase
MMNMERQYRSDSLWEDVMMLVFKDLDGTLLDRETYSFQAAKPALERLRQLDVPLVFVGAP